MREQGTGALGDANRQLVDGFGRQVTYLRMSVTDRCNLRCTYCMAEDMTFLPRSEVLSIEEMVQLGEAFVALGVNKIRLTGGEPLIRRGFLTLVEKLAALPGLSELAMTTNAALLDQYAGELAARGVQRLNISIDSLKSRRFRELTRTGDLAQVLRGIDSALRAPFRRIKLNAVILAGVNDDEIIDLAQFAVDGGMDISFIEEMPLGAIDSHHRADTRFTSADIRARLETVFQLTDTSETTGGPSRYVRVAGSDSRIGFISPLSNNFCASCNRVRLTAEGRLLLCLGNEHSLDLRQMLRNEGLDAQSIQPAILAAMQNKPRQHEFDPEKTDIVRFMNMTGG